MLMRDTNRTHTHTYMSSALISTVPSHPTIDWRSSCSDDQEENVYFHSSLWWRSPGHYTQPLLTHSHTSWKAPSALLHLALYLTLRMEFVAFVCHRIMGPELLAQWLWVRLLFDCRIIQANISEALGNYKDKFCFWADTFHMQILKVHIDWIYVSYFQGMTLLNLAPVS